jgi:protein gp37
MTDQRKGGITWTEQTWNPIRGCRRKSDECLNCYAQKMAARFSGPGQPYHGLALRTADGRGNWTGQIRMIRDHLLDPLRWQRPRLVFVNSMSDLFFEDLADTDIDQILAVMLLAKSHTFQVLTKRYDRMADYLTAPGRAATVAEAASLLLFDMASGAYDGFGANAVERFGGQWPDKGRTVMRWSG